jgi:uncharacterized protein YndB with AHSA1/START domain
MKIKIEATIAADPKAVWQIWTQPEHITKWNFASPEWHCPSASNDLRKGGKFVSRMEAKDGSFGFDFEGTYDEVIDQRKISYVMSDGRKVVTDFEKVGNQTKVSTVFDAEDENSAEMQKNGWQAILNNFKNYVERSSV